MNLKSLIDVLLFALEQLSKLPGETGSVAKIALKAATIIKDFIPQDVMDNAPIDFKKYEIETDPWEDLAKSGITQITLTGSQESQ